MAITNQSTALSKFNPVYNQVVHIFNSTNKNKPGFRYVIDVYQAGTSNKIFETRKAPRPGDGYGYIDLSKILANYITTSVNLSSTTSYNASDDYFKYDLKIGEEYLEEWEFDDTDNNSGKTKLTQSPAVTPHSYVVGDQILITCDDPSIFPNINGLYAVESTPDAYNIVVDVAYETTATNPGNVKFADGRKTITRDLLTYSGYVVFNSAFSFIDWPQYDPTDYYMNTVDDNLFLSDMPSGFTMAPDQDAFINMVPGSGTLISDMMIVTSDGDQFKKSLTSTGDIVQASIGPGNLGIVTVETGSLPVIKDTTKWYEFYVVDSSDNKISETKRIVIDRRCKIEDYEILFMDRKGSYSSFSFQLRSNETGKINRTSYRQQLGGLSSNKWTYDLKDPGQIDTNVQVEKMLKLQTNWMSNLDNIYFEQLLTSPVTYLKVNDIYLRCTVEESGFTVQNIKYRKLNKKTITVKLSNENIINI